jgi:enamine deaminase RidA (YjgF/YER057c/UK114 family)
LDLDDDGMNHSIVNPPELHDPTAFGYSHSVSVPAGSELVLVAGQYASGSHGEVAPGDFGAQVRQAFRNVELALAAHGLGLADVVQLRTYVVGLDIERLGALGQVVGGLWGAVPPTQTVIGVAGLAMPDILFEVEAVAARS